MSKDCNEQERFIEKFKKNCFARRNRHGFVIRRAGCVSNAIGSVEHLDLTREKCHMKHS